jgi:hypothetical protein
MDLAAALYLCEWWECMKTEFIVMTGKVRGSSYGTIAVCEVEQDNHPTALHNGANGMVRIDKLWNKIRLNTSDYRITRGRADEECARLNAGRLLLTTRPDRRKSKPKPNGSASILWARRLDEGREVSF